MIRIEAGQANIASLGAPDAGEMRWHQERTAVRIECEARLVRFLLETESHKVRNGPLVPMMSPDEKLPGQRAEGGKCFPVPRHGANGF